MNKIGDILSLSNGTQKQPTFIQPGNIPKHTEFIHIKTIHKISVSVVGEN
nr:MULTISPECIES: hypothetical protein [Bacteroidales]